MISKMVRVEASKNINPDKNTDFPRQITKS